MPVGPDDLTGIGPDAIKIGDLVYPAGCSAGYKLKNKMIVRYIKQSGHKITAGEGEDPTWSRSVSEDGKTWCLLSDVTRHLYYGPAK